MSTHARLAPSKAHRWIACPGSIRMEAGKPDKTSVYAAEGSVAHTILERCLMSGANAVGFMGQEVKKDGFPFTVDQEMVDAVQAALDYVRKTIGNAVLNQDFWVERRDGLEKIKTLKEPIFGTTDVCFWDAGAGALHIFDYKHGKGVVVEAEGNEQLMIYALTQAIRIGTLPHSVTLHVMQPRAYHEAGVIRTWTMGLDDLKAFRVKVVDAANATLEPDAPLNPGAHCRFCPALAECPAHFALAQNTAQEVFADTDEALPDPKDMEEDRLSFVLRNMDAVTSWFKAVEEHAKNLLNAGVPVSGYKLVRGRANRRWKDATDAEKALAKAGLKAKQRRKIEVISVAQAEKALKAAGKGLDAGLWEKPEGALTLVPESDARPAVTSAQDVFGALPDTTSEPLQGAA